MSATLPMLDAQREAAPAGAKAARLVFFARHEARLAWRDAVAMLGGRRSARRMLVGIVVFELIAHAIALEILRPFAGALSSPDAATLMVVGGSLLVTAALLASQAMETATRGFYARADLDLILSSPAPARALFAVRIAAIAAGTAAMSFAVTAPAIDVLAWLKGPRFLAAYPTLAAVGVITAAAAVWGTAALFRLLGAARTRLAAQVAAALVGASCVIGVQALAIVDHGSLSRLAVFRDPAIVARAPAPDSLIWLPVRAALGDESSLLLLIAAALLLIAATMAGAAGAFARSAPLVAGLGGNTPSRRRRATPLRVRSAAASLRRKEWALLKRDPWLVSQSLMQVLYLVPPALLLWHGGDGGPTVLVPVVVMAAGQLGGGLAWLAISGEDAPDLIATAPVARRAVLRAKIEAVASAVALPVLPLALAIGWVAPVAGTITLVGAALAVAGASAVQYVFRSRAQRSTFRRRQTSSRLATFAEAFVSISIAAAAGLAAAGLWLAVAPLAVAGAMLAGARAFAPKQD